MSTRYCPSCGTSLSDDARFCPTCGRPVSDDSTRTVSDDTRLRDDTRLSGERPTLTNTPTETASTLNGATTRTTTRTTKPGTTTTQRAESNHRKPRHTSEGSSNNTITWILGIIAAAAVGIGVAYFMSRGGSGESSYHAGQDTPDTLPKAETPAPGETEYETPGVATPQATASESMINYGEDYVSASSLYGDDLKNTTNFTRPDLTITDVHGHVKVMDVLEDGILLESWRYDSDGRIIASANSLKPSSVSRGDKGRILSGSYRGEHATYEWGNNLLSSIAVSGGPRYTRSYTSKGQLETVYISKNGGSSADRYSDYTYDDCKNWIYRVRTDENGIPHTQTRQIYYYRP